MCGAEGNQDPDVAEPVIGRAFARPVGSSGLRSRTRVGGGFDTLCQLMRVIVAPLPLLFLDLANCGEARQPLQL